MTKNVSLRKAKEAKKVGKEDCMPEFKTANQSKIIRGDSLD